MSTAILGLGPMGRRIARNLARAGKEPVVWNRTTSVADALRADGARPVASVEDAIAETVLSVLPDVDQLRDITGPTVWERWAASGVKRVVVMSTTAPSRIDQLGRDLAEAGLAVADAPMSGGEHGAEAGTLSIMLGADEHHEGAIREALRPAVSRIEWFGGPGSGSAAKLCNQIVVAGTLTSLAEAFAIGEKAGLDLEALARVFENGLAASAVLSAKRERLLTSDYTPSGSAVNQLKDLTYLAELADAVGQATPVTSAITPLFADVVADGRGQLDHSVVLDSIRRAARPR